MSVRDDSQFLGALARGAAHFITFTPKEPIPGPPERLVLIVTFPGGLMATFLGTRAEVDQKWDEVRAEAPNATHEVRPAPSLPLILPTEAGVIDSGAAVQGPR